jgi:hypothetical protein
MPKYKISEENAAVIVDELFEYYEIDPEFMTDDERDQYERQRRAFLKAVRLGRMELKSDDSQLKIVQHLKYPLGENNATPSITYGEPTGDTKRTGGKIKIDDHRGFMYSFMGKLSRTAPNILSKLRGPDLALMESLAAFFLLQ